MERLWRELTTTTRGLARVPAFTVVALTTLALGIGANAALFSVAEVLLLEPLPYPEPDELVAVWLESEPDQTKQPLSPVDLQALDDEPSLFQAVAGWARWSPTLSEGAGLSVIRAATVTRGMFGRVLATQPVLGRTFRSEEHLVDGTRTAIISDRFWVEHFGADPGVLGRAVSLDDIPYTVVGVMRAGFRPPFAADANVWTPVVDGRGPEQLTGIARLAPGVSAAVARERALVAGRRAAESWPGAIEGRSVRIEDLRAHLLGPAPTGLRLLLIAFGLVLLASCGNAAALLVARGAARTTEFRVRRALGAERRAIARHCVVESVLLGLGGAGAGLFVAVWATEALLSLAPLDRQLFATPGLSGRVLAYTAGLATAAGVLVGLFSAARSDPPDLVPGRYTAMGRAEGWRVAFVGAQVACAVSLATGAALMTRTVDALDRADLGFEPESRYVIDFDPPAGRLVSADAALAHYEALEDRIGRMPGVLGVGSTSAEPLRATGRAVRLRMEMDRDGARLGSLGAEALVVTPGYFYAAGQRILDGRELDVGDDAGSESAVVVSESLARALAGWPAWSPVGRRLALLEERTAGWRTIVGVVEDARDRGPRADPEPLLYLPARQVPVRAMSVVAHIDGDADDVLERLAGVTHEADAPVVPARIEPLQRALWDVTRPERFVARLLGALAALTLVLACIGVYGLVGHRVASRIRELGVRRALGATAEDLRELVTRRAARLTMAGALVGAASGVAFTDFIDALLFEVPRLDPLSITASAGLLLVVAFSAARVPASRAARVDPMRVLRGD